MNNTLITILTWIEKFKNVNGKYPSSDEIIAQLYLALDQENLFNEPLINHLVPLKKTHGVYHNDTNERLFVGTLNECLKFVKPHQSTVYFKQLTPHEIIEHNAK